jgi:hypothetical protein
MAGRISYYGGIVKDGLVLNLDAAKKDSYPGSGTVWNDLSGNNNSGSLINGPTYSSANGGSIVFDGSNDYIDTVDSSIFSLTSSYTFSVWFMPLNSGTMYPLQRGTDGLGSGWSLLAGIENNKCRVGVVTTSTGAVGYTVSSVLNANTNEWVNITGVWNAAVSLSLYVNGSFISSTNITTNTLRTSSVAWSLGRISTTLYSNQRVANCFIYNRVLSTLEIAQNYNALKSRFGL